MGRDMLNATKYITTVPFSGLFNWSVQYLNDSKIAFNKKYPMMSIGELLARSKDALTIQDDVKYTRVTIKVRNGGVFKRDEVMGEKIGTKKQYRVYAGQFILSKIDARNGSMGIVPQELNGAVVTQDFLPYDIDTEKINPQYLVLVSTTQQFMAFCQSCSSGTTNRQRIDETQFLNIKIPVPSLKEQNKLVEVYNRQISIATDSEERIASIRDDISTILFTGLGVEISKDRVLNRLSTISFSVLDRWDIAYLQNNSKICAKYKIIRFQDCIELFMKRQDGTSLRIETRKQPSNDFHYIGMEYIEKATGELKEIPIVKGVQIKSQTIAIPKGYFIYGKLRPYLNKYWYNNTDWEDIVCSSELFVFKIKDSINTRFFELVLGSDIVQKQIADLASGARMPRITEEIFMNIQIPMPPVEVQNHIVNQIFSTKNNIKELQQIAKQQRSSALTAFEAQIFE